MSPLMNSDYIDYETNDKKRLSLNSKPNLLIKRIKYKKPLFSPIPNTLHNCLF